MCSIHITCLPLSSPLTRRSPLIPLTFENGTLQRRQAKYQQKQLIRSKKEKLIYCSMLVHNNGKIVSMIKWKFTSSEIHELMRLGLM